jgi:hypothetical protein
VKHLNFLNINVLLSISSLVICPSAMALQIFVDIADSGKTLVLEAEANDTIENIRSKVQEEEGIATSAQQLSFMTLVLQDDRTLSDYGIDDEDTLLLNVLNIKRHSPLNDYSTYGQFYSHLNISHRFTNTQMNNIWSHVNSLHNNFTVDNNRFSFGLNANQYQDVYRMLKQVGYDLTINKRKNRSIAARSADSTDPVQLASNTVFSDIITDIPTVPDMGNTLLHRQKSINDKYLKNMPFSVWGTGNLEYGSLDLSGNTQHFSSSGVTVGIDSQPHPDLILGSAVGYGFGNDKLDNLGSRTSSEQITASLYMSYFPHENWSFDGILGYGDISLQNRRWTSMSDDVMTGERDGHISFGSFSLNRLFNFDIYQLHSYVRGDITNINLDDYDEFNADSALSYQSVSTYAKSTSAGTELLCNIPVRHGQFTSSVALQYTHNFSGNAEQDLYYKDLGATSPHYTISIQAPPVSTVSLGTSLKYINSDGHSIDLAYTALNGSNSYRASQVNLTAKLQF